MTSMEDITFRRGDKTVLPNIISHLRGSAVCAGWVLNDLLNYPKQSDFRYSGEVGTNEFSYIHRSGHPSTRDHPTYMIDGAAERLCEVIPGFLSGTRWTIRESPRHLADLVHERCGGAQVFYQQQMNLKAGELTVVDSGEARRLGLADRDQLSAFTGIGNAPGLDRWIQHAIIVGVFHDGSLVSMGSTIYVLPEVSALVGIRTLPEFQGQGFGRKVTTKLAQLALERSANVTLTVRSDNDPARRLYESMGFRGGEERFWASLGNNGLP
jgi:ribosomal protein S18 acetylase RimI-like enzyme